METELPIVIVNGSIKSLKSLLDRELETFLAYLVRFTAAKFNCSEDIQPEWWKEPLKFPIGFTNGAPIPYMRNKLHMMRSLVKSCYYHYGLTDLLSFSEELSKTHALEISFEQNADMKTVTIMKDRSPVAKIPAMNLNYDYRHRLINLPDVSLHAIDRKPSRHQLDLKPHTMPILAKRLISDSKSAIVDLVSDEEEFDTVVIESSDEDDCVVLGVFSVGPKSKRKRLPPPPPKTLPRNARMPIIKIKEQPKSYDDDCIIILDDDEEENAFLKKEEEELKKPVTQDGFLRYFHLGKSENEETQGESGKTKTETNKKVSPVINQRLSKKRITFSFLSSLPALSLIPRLVHLGLIPKKCLASTQAIQRSMDHIRKNTNADAIDYYSMVKPCSVRLKKLTDATIRRLTQKKLKSKQQIRKSLQKKSTQK